MEKYKMTNPSATSLDKCQFPRLLSKLIDNMGMRSSSNLIAGFKACGIVPLNESTVMRKFPSTKQQAKGKESEAVLAYLHQFKYSPGGPKKPRVTRKKITVEPGKSVSAEELASVSATRSTSPKSTPGPSRPPSRVSKASQEVDTDTSEIIDDSEDEWEPRRKNPSSRNVFKDLTV